MSSVGTLLIAATIGARPTLLLAISIAGSGESSVAISELFRLAAASLESRAHVRLITPEQASLEAGLVETCGAKPSCWMRSLAALGEMRPKYLVILGAVTRADAPALFSAVAVEVGDPSSDDELLARAIAPAGFRPIADGQQAAMFFEELFGSLMRPVFERNGDWGRPLDQLPKRAVAPPVSVDTESVWRTPMFYSGLALVAAGASVFAYSIAASPSEERHRVCVDPAMCAGETRFRSEGSVKLAPLAYSLGASGAAWVIGARVFDEDEKLWISALVGLVIGAGAYGISVAAD